MLLFLAEALALYGLSWVLWKTCRRFVFKSVIDNIPGPTSTSFWTGSLKDIYSLNGWAYHKEIAANYGSVIKVKGLFGENQLYIFDPKALHNILVKDQDVFEESPLFISLNKLFFGEGLLGTLGEQHRKQRKMLNPVFSIAHMRNMVPIFYDISYKLRDAIGARVTDGPQEIELVSWMTRTALELIGQTGLGYSFDSLTDDVVAHPYTSAVKKFISTLHPLRFAMLCLGPTLPHTGPAKLRRLILNMIPWKGLHDARDIVDVMSATSKEIYESKKKALAEGDEALANQIGKGKDIMSILMRANMSASKEDSLTEDELLAQMSSLIFAAMDTTSNALSRILHLLATHVDVQERLRKEIANAREQCGGGDLSYDTLVSLPYLDAICRETMRIHTPVTTLRRTTRQDVVLPLSTPVQGLDGREIREIPMPKNTEIILGILACNRNPEIWGPDADEWKPERWLSPLPETVAKAHLPGIYSHLMTFIGGGRACIGFKFSQLEMKVVLLLLIESFRFRPSDKEISWQMMGITSPIVKGSKSKAPLLPLIVERAE